MTVKQDLVAHLEAEHGEHNQRGTHKQLALHHKAVHDKQHRTHSHKPDGWATGNEQMQVLIHLSPPKNASSNRRGDRNWTLTVSNMTAKTGWRYEIPGTRYNDSEGAINEANKLLGYVADWEPVGWGFKVMTKEAANA